MLPHAILHWRRKTLEDRAVQQLHFIPTGFVRMIVKIKHFFQKLLRFFGFIFDELKLNPIIVLFNNRVGDFP